MKQPSLIAVFLLLISANLFAGGGDKTIAPATLKSATVYRNGAELFHTAKATLVQGNNELVIEGVSNNIDMNSVQLGTDGNVTILSVSFSKDHLRPAQPSARMNKLHDSLESVNKDLASLQVLIKTDQEILDLLKSNKEIRGTQTGLSVAELTKMVDYYKAKTLELQKEISQYREKEIKLQEAIGLLNLQVKEEEQKNTKTIGKLQLLLYCPVGGQFNFNLSYYTPLAAWYPAYDIRVDNINNPVKLSYKAKLAQTTGIDWNNVKLTLATSVPNQQNNAPELKSWFLAFQQPSLGNLSGMLQGRVAGVVVRGASSTNLEEVVVAGYGGNGSDQYDRKTEVPEPLYIVNGNEISKSEFKMIEARAIKEMKVLKDSEASSLYGSRATGGAVVATLKEDLGDYISVNDNQLNVTFEIDLPYDIPTNGKEQNVSLKDYTVQAQYRYYAAPGVDKDAYLLGEMADWESLNLLPGDANIIFEGTYIGKTHIDPASIRDTLNLTLGRDKRVVIKREKLKDFSSVKFLGANKKQVFTYEITVKNNKKENVELLLKEIYPLSTNKDIEVEVLEISGATNDPELGQLSWKTTLTAGESKKYRVSYSIKYPKDKKINLP